MKKIFTILGVSAVALMSAQNLIPNPGFEAWTAGAPDGYYVTGTTIVQGTGANKHSGNFAVGITAPTAATGNKTINPTPDINVEATKTYVFSGWVLDNTPNAKFKYWNQFRNTADLGSNPLQAGDFTVDSPQWIFFSAEAVPTAGATVARPGLRVYGESAANNGGVIYVDDISFQDKATMAVTDVKAFDSEVKMNTVIGNELQVTLPGRATVNIISADGKLISSNRINSGDKINTSSLTKGIYIVTVDNGSAKVSRKVMKK
ncbi:T9SS type A sorting domain-containing protein [Kaistella sp. G5-32]|uniref:T9SS type A sorting domain-containing protein n=1 Tax=Kaistella gelatinilytica TaxID=2787636 RepID=A0ABS0FAP2_9FLAO|nr:T9SS type A sorting domain-containing protein [Kaistella gelatinilytica]MBF8456778.1 T9SS type A sorting domain-containing protein [Kaistella gelatinilytica]